MTRDSPILTVVVPSFNQGKYLEQSLAELCRWVDFGVEVIVVDGGSTDESVEIIRRYESKLSFWRSFRDGGQAAAINEGLARARGEWLAFQNSDDYYVPDILPIILSRLEKTKSEVLLAGTKFVDLNDVEFALHKSKPVWPIAMAARNYINNQSLFVSSRLYQRVGGLDPLLRFCLDYEWFVRLLKNSEGVLCAPEIVGVQRFHPETKTSTIKSVHDEEFVRVRARYYSRREIWAARLIEPIYRAYRLIYGFST